MADTEQQVTKQKKRKRVYAGKAIAERTIIARELYKKALIEAHANQQTKPSDPPPVADSLSVPGQDEVPTAKQCSVNSE